MATLMEPRGVGHFPTLSKKQAAAIRVSPLLVEASGKTADEVYALLNTCPGGLTQADAEEHLAKYGPNEVAREKRHGALWRLGAAVKNPLVILLMILSIVSYATGDFAGGTVMTLMVILGVMLRFVQESRADAAAARLKAMISVTATVIRDGQPKEIPLKEIVPGDVIKLGGRRHDPGDVRLVSCKDLFVIQASLTGESLPVEKIDVPEKADGRMPLELRNLCFLGTSVESGTARAVVVATGPSTYFGSMASNIMGTQVETSFDKGIHKFTWLMIRIMMVMVPLVFVINGITKHDWKEAFLFSPVGGGRVNARDATDDRLGLLVQGRDGHVAQEGHRQAPQCHPELWRDGRVVHGQDRHADDGPRDFGEVLRRDLRRE